MEPRFAACIAWGAQWDYHDTWKKRIDASFKTSLSVPGHHIEWIMGAKSVTEALQKLEPFKLDGVMQKMRCPFLLVHGADDEQIAPTEITLTGEPPASPCWWTPRVRWGRFRSRHAAHGQGTSSTRRPPPTACRS